MEGSRVIVCVFDSWISVSIGLERSCLRVLCFW